MNHWLYFLLLLLLTGCASVKPQQNARMLSDAAGMARQDIPAGQFTLTTYSRVGDLRAPIHVYIEGDGFAWISRYKISPDPTPKKAIGLALAAADVSPNVVYIARPCQFRNLSKEDCPSTYWTDRRFADEVVTSVNRVVSHFAPQSNGKIHLIGYSGGGAVATLVAARRSDVASLRTLAGNLDHVAVNQHHEVSAMPGSLNAMDMAVALSGIPQLHFIGEDDKVIPAEVTKRFVQATGQRCARWVLISAATHDTGWVERWQDMLKLPVECAGISR